MHLNDSNIQEIQTVLNTIIDTHTMKIFSKRNKNKFKTEILNSKLDIDEIELLLTLLYNDAFVFICENNFYKASINIKSCLRVLGYKNNDINKVLKLLMISDKIKKVNKFKFSKIIFMFLVSSFLFCITFGLVIFRTIFLTYDFEKLIFGGKYTVGQNKFQIGSYYIGKTEVTVEEYEKLLGKIERKVDKNLPITNITWFEAIIYCNKLSNYYELEPVYEINDDNTVIADFDANGFRLPTKIEWLFAATEKRKNIDSYVWYLKNSEEKLHEVGLKLPNKNKVYDMYGNASEWCWDYEWSCEDILLNFPRLNPTGPNSGRYRTVCGGYFGNSEEYIFLENSLNKALPDSCEIYRGFRVARSIKIDKKTIKQLLLDNIKNIAGKLQ